MSRELIDDPDALGALAARLADAERVALDVEGDGLYRYRARVCTLQLSTGRESALVDALALESLDALSPLLAAEGPIKVVHDVSFDAKMLAQRGLGLGRVFDTAVAARFLGERSTGLAALLEKHFGVALDKAHQQADWGERPLSEAQVDYLLDDVRHLPALADEMEARARALDVLEEIEEETRYAMARALEPETPRAPWTRVKGARDLAPAQQAVLRALANVREREAEARDVPPFRVASNRVLFEAARRRPRAVKDLRRIRGLRRLSDARLQEALDEAQREGPPREEPPAPPPPPEDRAKRKAREKALTAWRAEEAERRGVDPQVVLPGHCLRDLAQLGDRDALGHVPGLGDKRIARYGEALRALLAAAG
jgi:ribonuclease D